MRKGALLLAAVVAVVVGPAVAARVTAGGRPSNARVPTNRPAARAAAERLLATLELPAGATRLDRGQVPSLLAGPPTRPLTPDLVDIVRFWQVRGGHTTVYDWIRRHPPAGSLASEAGAEGPANGSVAAQWLGFSFLATPAPEQGSETLLVETAAARGGGTAIRVDAQVVWRRPRSAAERIPGGVSAITIAERRVTGSSAGPWTVSDRRRVRRIVALVNALPLGPAGPVACPADMGPYVTLTFASGGHGIARAVADGSGCGFVGLTIHGHREPFLTGGVALIRQLSSLLRMSL